MSAEHLIDLLLFMALFSIGVTGGFILGRLSRFSQPEEPPPWWVEQGLEDDDE